MARVRWDRVGRIGLLLVLGVVACVYAEHIVSFVTTKAQDDRQLAVVHTLMADNARLARQQKSLGQASTIIADARKLGMVLTGEHPYVVTSQLGH
jgi:cell division protein FtsL